MVFFILFYRTVKTWLTNNLHSLTGLICSVVNLIQVRLIMKGENFSGKKEIKVDEREKKCVSRKEIVERQLDRKKRKDKMRGRMREMER